MLNNYKIENITSEDFEWVCKEGKEFLGLISDTQDYYDLDTLLPLLYRIKKDGVFLKVVDGSGRKGFIGGVFIPSLYNRNILNLQELFWWVPVKHRKSRAGLLLMKEFVKIGKENNVDNIVFSSMSFSPINEDALIKRRFALKERSFVMEVL